MRATAPAGAAAYEGRVLWSGELGYGVRPPEQGQTAPATSPPGAGHGHHHDDAHAGDGDDDDIDAPWGLPGHGDEPTPNEGDTGIAAAARNDEAQELASGTDR
jgi:hypothetical protein